MILVPFAQPDFTIMGMSRIDAGAVPMLASPPAPQPLLSKSANPMNRTRQGIHSRDHQDCGVCTKGRVLGADSARAVSYHLPASTGGKLGGNIGSRGTSPTSTTSGWTGPRLMHEPGTASWFEGKIKQKDLEDYSRSPATREKLLHPGTRHLKAGPKSVRASAGPSAEVQCSQCIWL